MEIEQVDESFRKILNTHGYGFQYAVLEAIERARRFPPHWHSVASELGVEVRGRDTRIDHVIQKGTKPFYLIGECKRANPATAYWCFAKANLIRMEDYARQSFAEVLIRHESSRECTTRLQEIHLTNRAYQVALEVRTGQKGDSSSAGRGAIEDAVGQVCRGLNGFLEFMAKRRDLTPPNSMVIVLPVVFTTARLFVSPVDIGTADLLSGNLKHEMQLEEIDWVWYDYPQSPGLKQ